MGWVAPPILPYAGPPTTSLLPDGPTTPTTAPLKTAEGMRFNDGKVSPQGTFVVGRMHAKWREGNRGRLYRLDPGRWGVDPGGVEPAMLSGPP